MPMYHIRSIRHCSYDLFHRPSLCGVYSRGDYLRAVFIVAAREAIRIEKRSLGTTELGDSDPFADVEG